MSTEKAVADEPKVESQTTTEESGAQVDDLDKLLDSFNKEFDQGTKEAPKVDAKDTTIAELTSRVDYLMNQMNSTDVDKAVDAVAKHIGEDLTIPKRAIRGILNDMAIEDPRLRKAYENRRSDPAGWNKVLKAAGKAIRNEFSGLPDKKLTDDREAVAATIRGASKTSSSEDDTPNFSKMSDSEYEEWKRKH